ncbi:nuclease PIN [Mycobacterium sp. E2462]|uniref:sensor domain-containing protein n=1 Tax=Mycobacterium sp. E2462 TaxID=1834133 RepID=UPI0007FE2B78|nr:sensor domain-containing protein [Mycobacterium sp. E2462]OBI02865.1 nuclease PIN [Mycobacterium sp. E2462]
MTNPHDEYWQGPLSYDPLGRVPPAPELGSPALPPPPPPAPSAQPVNILATLSVVFAFVFAPVGAILGHQGLAQIRGTGEAGRERALAGLALSYLFTAVGVLALITWATLGAAPTRTAAAAPPPAPGSAAPPPPAVAPDAVGTLLPTPDALKNLVNDDNLEAGPTWNKPGRSAQDGSIDRPECWSSVAAGAPDAYDGGAVAGYHAAEFVDTRSMLKSTHVIAGVAAFGDPASAQAQLSRLLAGWRQCGGTTVTVTTPSGQPIPMSVGEPSDAGGGVTTLDLTPKDRQVRVARAVAAKANVVVDVNVSASGTTDGQAPRLAAAGVAKYVLAKIPG